MSQLYFRFRNLKFNSLFGATLIIVFSVPRFLMVLEANRTGNYNFTSIIFVVMALAPFLLLTKAGRQRIGLKKVTYPGRLFQSFVLGMLLCTIVYLAGKYLYQDTIENWFFYISRSFKTISLEELHKSRSLYFVLFALVGMTFSPLGEEFLYRGLIHESFVPKLGNNGSSLIDSAAFALVHLAHFGIVFLQGHWDILYIPALLWMLFMFVASRLFFYCKTRSNSIFGAVFCHAGFNFAMTYFIFYHIL